MKILKLRKPFIIIGLILCIWIGWLVPHGQIQIFGYIVTWRMGATFVDDDGEDHFQSIWIWPPIVQKYINPMDVLKE